MVYLRLGRIIFSALIAAQLGASTGAQSPATAYDQPYRPQVHFSPREHWTNDPNGLVYFEGEYHLFYQYNPFGDEWGHMSWGHAVSSDLLHWHELPVAIPEQDGVMIFTGSVVVDAENSSGFCAAHTPCLVAVYTGDGNTPEGHRETQNLAYSLDKGRTWTKYKQNPVIDLHMANFRDPSVSWNEETRRWVMAVSLPKEHKVRFYSSPDLKAWTLLSEFGPTGDIAGDWECPDLLRIPAGHGKENMWALKVGLNPGAPQGGSGEQYFLGSFDGTTFHTSSAPGAHGWTNYGKDDYCAISYNGLPKGENPTLIGWMSNWTYAAKLPTSPWRGQMSIPRRLSFVHDADGVALRQEPVLAPVIAPGKNGPLKAPFEVTLSLDHGIPSAIKEASGVRIYSDDTHWTEIGFDPFQKQFYIDRTHAGMEVSPDFPARTVAPLSADRRYDLTLIVDRSSVEAFAQEGTIVMTDLIYPLTEKVVVKTFPEDKSAIRTGPVVTGLNSIW